MTGKQGLGQLRLSMRVYRVFEFLAVGIIGPWFVFLGWFLLSAKK